eukprot:9423188-Lingulodinium_polyedra.AAC.1
MKDDDFAVEAVLEWERSHLAAKSMGRNKKTVATACWQKLFGRKSEDYEEVRDIKMEEGQW